MKSKILTRSLALFLACVLCVGMLPTAALAENANPVVPPDVSYENSEETISLGDEDAETQETVVAGPWKMQKFGSDTDVEIKEGWITPDTEGTGFIADYGAIYQDKSNGGNVVIYNSEAAVYADSTLEFDVTVTGGQPDKYQVAFFPRFQSGKNCDGMGIDGKTGLQHAYQEGGKDGYPGVPNKLNMSFLTGQTYHIKMVTAGYEMAVYVGDELLTEFNTRDKIENGKYGFRIWTQTDAKTVHIANIERSEIKDDTSATKELAVNVPYSDWCKGGLNIPVHFASGDNVASITDGMVPEGDELGNWEAYPSESRIYLKPAFFERYTEEDNITLNVTFTSEVEDYCYIVREDRPEILDGWVLQEAGSEVSIPIQEKWITAINRKFSNNVESFDESGIAIHFDQISKDTGKTGPWIIYREAGPEYLNSSIQFHINTLGSGNWIGAGILPRVNDGKNYEGFALTGGSGLMYCGRKDGTEASQTITNTGGFNFQTNKIFGFRVETAGGQITFYATGNSGEEKQVATFASPAGIGESSYGFFFQQDGGVQRTVEITGITRVEGMASVLGKTKENIAADDWGKDDVTIPVSFGKDDSVASITKGQTALTATTDYTVDTTGITLKKEYIEKQDGTFKLSVSFVSGSSGEVTFIRNEEHGWVLQKQNSTESVVPKEGWITSTENGGVSINYGKISSEGGGGEWVAFDGKAPSYQNSSLEYDITFTNAGGSTEKFETVLATRVTDGKNYEGFAISKGADLQRQLRKDGKESYNGVSNLAGFKFEYNKTYHLRIVTEDSRITVYVTQGGGAEQKLTTFNSPDGLESGSYGFRFWGDGKPNRTITIENVERTEVILSTLEKSMAQIGNEDWGCADVSVPVNFGIGDSLTAVYNGETALEAGKDYTIEGSTFTLKKEYIAAQPDTFRLQFTFALGSEASLWVVKYDPTARQEYTWTPEKGVTNWEKIFGAGTFAMEDGGLRIKGELALVNTSSPACLDGEVELTYQQLNDNGNTGILFRADDETDVWQGVWQDTGYMQRYYFKNSEGTQGNVHGDCSFPFSREGYAEHKMKMRIQGSTVTLWLDDQFVSSTEVKAATPSLGNLGILTGGSCDILLKKAVFRTVLPFAPEVDDSEDKSITKAGMTVRLANDFPRVKDYTINSKTLSGTEFKYNYVTINTVDYPATATVKASTVDSVTYTVTPTGCDVTFDVVFAVMDGHVLEMRINEIDETNVKVYSIGFPNQPLISANSTQVGAKLDATVFQENMFTGNQWDQTTLAERHYVVAEDKMSKTVSESATLAMVTNEGLSASMANNVLYNIHEFQIKAFDLPQGGVSAGVYNTEFVHRGLDGKKMFPIASEPEEEDLYCRIVVTEDTNDDGLMDWQDGANALKTIISDKIPGGDKAARSFFQVGYNFVSEAQQPFLKVEDNLKRLSNLIDGFDQVLVLKGYANEGHDSAHADYDDISKRAGGADDLNAMTDAIKDINATFGIHINNTEAYPEAKMFTDENMTNHNAWKWMDQSKELRREVYILNGGMDGNLDSLFTKAPDIGFVYVDTYGDDRWCSARLADNLIGHGAMMGTENKNDLDRYVSWVHWPDINANSMHSFVYHTQKDVYNGSGTDLMWGGYGRGDSFMSWQHHNNISPIVKQFYTNQLPQKYLMCHDVRKMTGTEAIFEDGVRSTSDKKIYKDDHLIADGEKGKEKIFIPWFAEDSATRNPDEAAKIYHWNTTGGETTWYLPSSWSELATVKLYKTTQNGKVLVETIEVKDGQVTINAQAGTPYVVYQGEAKADVTDWSVGSPIKDTSFNSRDFSIWQKAGEANIAFNDDGNGVSILTMSGTEAGQVSQVMTGLTPGQRYRALVWAGSDKGKTARITVETPDGKVYENYVNQTVRGNNCFDTYADGKWVDRVWVDFVQPEGQTTATITLSADACAAENGKVTFMESRIVKTADPGLPSNDEKLYFAYETFEYIEQGGTGIFTPEGGGDGGYHLSETHLPYTSDTIPTGVNGEVSNWSLKMYGYGRASMRTRPSSMRLLPNTTYTMEFDILGNGTVYIQSEADSNVKVLNQSIKQGHNKFSFTTDGRTDYIARFTGCDVLDNFQVYAIKDLTPPTKPGELAAVVEDNLHVTLTWTAAADEDSGIRGYKVYRDGKLLATLGNVLTYTDKTVEESTDYTYQVSAVNGGFTEGDMSNEVKAEVGADTTSPTVEKVVLNNLNTATLTFSEKLDKASAETAANYHVTGAVTVTAASLKADGYTVILTLSGLATMDVATLRVVGVKDTSIAGNAMSGEQELTLSTLVHYFKFDETEGNTAKDSAGHEDAVKANTVKVMDGKEGKAAQFEANGYADLSGGALYRQNEFTLSTWINWGGKTSESQTIFSNGASGDGNSYGIWLHVRGDEKLWVSFKNNNGGYTDLNSGSTLMPTGEWAHVAFVKRADGADLYVNGTKVATSNVAVNIGDYTNKMRIGGNYDTSGGLLHKFKGGIDEFKIFTAALTKADIADLAGMRIAATPEATFEAATMHLSNVTAGMEYSVDGGTTWAEITGTTADLSGAVVTVTNGIRVKQPGDGETTVDSEVQIITLTQAAAPGGVTAKDETSARNDGALMGTTTDMEYRAQGGTEWAACSADTTTVAHDTYEIRVAGKGTELASESIVVTVNAYVAPPTGGGGSTTKPPVVTENPDGSKTKTETDKKTGNVTETTTYPDGTKIVATTPKDGKTSIEVTVPKNKEKVTVTIPADKQPAPGEVAVIIHEDGTREIIKTSVSTKDGLRVTLTGNAKLEIVDNSKTFADMAEGNWAYDAVQFAASRELFQGTSGDSFSPAGDMTRSMLITVLARLDGQDTTGGETWYSKAMDWGKESGITDGTNADASITRESLVVMLYRYAKVEKTDGMALDEFSDADEVSGWASEAMNWAVANGILNGSGGKLNPTATATRAEVAAMLMRFVENAT